MPGTMTEQVYFVSETAAEAIASAAAFLAGGGVELTYQDAHSVAFASPAGAPPGAGQVAAVPLQLRPGWCRVWVTASGGGPAVEAARSYAQSLTARSQALQPEVAQLEASILSAEQWPAYAARLRQSLRRQGESEASIELRVAHLQRRWDALRAKANRAGPEPG